MLPAMASSTSSHSAAPWYSRAAVHAFVWSPAVQNVIITVIIVNSVILGVQTLPLVEAAGGILDLLDAVCVFIYVVEIALKLYADGLQFFRSGWNVFDFVIVAISLIPGARTFAALRALRVLRVLRLVSAVPSLRRVIDSLARSVSGIASVATLLGIIFYVGAVMATMLFGAAFPELFGSLGSSFFTLFQLMTLDDWANITRDVAAVYPYAPGFFVVFVLVSALTLLNLVVAVIVDAMQRFDGTRDSLETEVTGLRIQIQELTDILHDQPRSGTQGD